MTMSGTLEYLLPVSVGAATLSVFIAFLVIRCYLQWKRQHRKEQLMAEGAVPKLVLSSQPVDFLVPLLIQDRLEEEEEVDQFKTHSSVSGASSEDISHEAELKNQTAERKVHPSLSRLDSEASVVKTYGQQVNLRSHVPPNTRRGESLFFDDGAESFHSSDESLLPRCFSTGPQPRPLRRRSRGNSLTSLSLESLSEESTLPDHTLHMIKSKVSSIDRNAPNSKLTKQRKQSAYTGTRRSRKISQVSRKRGEITLKLTFSGDRRTLEVHLINATELPLRHGRMLDVFARLSLKTPSKRRGERFQSRLVKKTCNPVFDERFVFKNLHLTEFEECSDTFLSFPSTDESLLPRCFSTGPQPRPLRRRSRGNSLTSLSLESLSEESTLPDHTLHMIKSKVSSIDRNAPNSKLTKQRKQSAYTGTRRSRKISQVSRKRGEITLKLTFSGDRRTLEVHLINATELPLRHGRMLDVFARLSLKTPSKRRGERFQSRLVKKTCNPVFDERFVFKNLHLTEFKKGRLKIRLFDRHGVSRYELIGETVFSLCDESILRGDKLCRELSPQVSWVPKYHVFTYDRRANQGCTSLISVCFLFLEGPFVAVELTYNCKEEVIQKHQTKARKKDLTINEEFSFEVATNSSCTLENFGVQFTVFQHDFVHGNEVIGHVRLGKDAPFPSEINHWKAVTRSPHKLLQDWHKLHGPL
ncbi:uncharacterized protein LOC111334661 [Stylophora pistillata]|uniref:uncharacterized protein LOC111334661 n=1 Tax=Stylophora pistillata TaxID=50429 RepID=UPI000C042811|nr:uncharacterized protein LOC111334661 [Stylophora pistillata]